MGQENENPPNIPSVRAVRQEKGKKIMLCEKCNKKKVTVFYRESINGRNRALRLCNECTDALEQAGELEDVSAAVAGGISPRFLSDDTPLPLPFPGTETGRGKASACKCPLCGTTASEIASVGRVGCAACYTCFEAELTPTIRAAHGRVEHTGRTTAAHRARMQKSEQVAQLKKKLREAVSGENYESAAGLRDEIRALEAQL